MLKASLFACLHTFSRFVPLSRLISWTGQSLFLPFYHAVGTHLPHIHHLYPPRSEQQFRADLDYLLAHYEPIDLEQLWVLIKNETPLKKPAFLLSFDDGLREVYDIVRPILLQKGIPAVVFLNPEFVDNQALMFRYKASLLIEQWDKAPPSSAVIQRTKELLVSHQRFRRDLRTSLLGIRFSQRQVLDQIAHEWQLDWQTFLQDQRPYLSLRQIQHMQQEGFVFGAHSLDHRRYGDWPLSEQLRQTQDSMAWVQQHLSPSLRAFAFPFTDYGVTEEFFEAILGPHGPIDVSFGGAGLKQDVSPRQLQRFPMEKTTRPAHTIIPAEYVYYLLKAPFGKNTLQRKNKRG
ncbi:MAG: polysaccharide deacetylase family protein [Bacteroidota bacterium]